MDVAVLGGGCFWCLEAVFEQLEGVKSVVSGYCGGSVKNPNYAQVCEGSTGHAEVVQIYFDPQVLPYKDLLEIFFFVHDPTTRNRQGHDIGSQYRSVIVAQSEAQEQEAREVTAELEQLKIWDSPIVTEILSAQVFFPAEEYHQKYFRRNPSQGYCSMVISPKVTKFRKLNLERLKLEFR